MSSKTVFGTYSKTMFNLSSLRKASLNFTKFGCSTYLRALTSRKAILRIIGF